jgi:uncharacterized protein YdeI (YjbR/CyaY-like superfamily)
MTAKKLPEHWLICGGVLEWHDWLSQHHRTASGVWLKIRKVGSTQAGVTLAEAVGEAICFGWIDSKMLSLDDNSFILRFSSRKADSIWSLNNRTRAERLLAEGRMAPAGLQTIQAAQASGSWQAAYTSLEKPVIPDDLAAALEAEPDACRHFETWSNSDKLQVTVWIGQARQPRTRIKRIRDTVNWARSGKIPPGKY